MSKKNELMNIVNLRGKDIKEETIELGNFVFEDKIFEVGFLNNKTYFIVFDKSNQQITKQDYVCRENEVIVPYSANKFIKSETVIFPADAIDYGNEDFLLKEIESFIKLYVTLPKEFISIVSHYVFLTWVYDKFEAVPYIRPLGDYGTGKSRLLKILANICYRPICLTGAASDSVIYRSLDKYRGTVIADEFDKTDSSTKACIIKVLNQGFQKGWPVLRCKVNESFDADNFYVFGPKVIATRCNFVDDAIESRCITIPMNEILKEGHIESSLSQDFLNQAIILRNKLLMYRFKNYNTDFKKGSLSDSVHPRFIQMTESIIAVSPSEKLRENLISDLNKVYSQTVETMKNSLEAEILKAYIDLNKAKKDITCQDISAYLYIHTNINISAKQIGNTARNKLGISPKRTSIGFIIQVNKEELCRLLTKYGLNI